MREYTIEHRVTYKETDQMGFVYYSNYLVWFEMARTELLRANGANYKRLEEKGFFLPVAEAQCRYRVPLKYDDLIAIKVVLTEKKRSRMTFEYEISCHCQT